MNPAQPKVNRTLQGAFLSFSAGRIGCSDLAVSSQLAGHFLTASLSLEAVYTALLFYYKHEGHIPHLGLFHPAFLVSSPPEKPHAQ